MGSHTVLRRTDIAECATPNPTQKGWYSIYLPQRDGRLSWTRWLVTYRDGSPTRRRSPIQVL